MRLTGLATIAWRLGLDSCSTRRFFLITQLDPPAGPAFRLSPAKHRHRSTTCCVGTHTRYESGGRSNCCGNVRRAKHAAAGRYSLKSLKIGTAQTLQMGDVEMPVGPVCNMNIAVRPVGIGDVVDLHAGRKHVDDDRIIERHDARAQLFASDKLAVGRIHGEKVTSHPDEISFMAFHRTDEMTLRVTLEELPVNDVNVLASINDHKLIDVCFAFRLAL